MSDPWLFIGPTLVLVAIFMLIAKGQADAKRRDREQKKEQQQLIDAIRGNDGTQPMPQPEAEPASAPPVKPEPHHHSTSALQRLKQRNE